MMSLTKFKLPGKDCRCIMYDGRVCKIKTLMPPLNEGIISDYVDDKSLQEEIEDIIRSVLCIPENVDPVMMRTQHLVVKPEKKEWKLPDKVVFKLPNKPLVALSYMYILHLQLCISKQEIHQESPVQKTIEEHVQSNKRKPGRSPSKSSEQIKRLKRRPISEKTTLSSYLPRRSNRRLAPSRGSPSSTRQSGRVLRKRALRFTSINKNSTSNNSNEKQRGGSNTFPPVDVDLDEAGMVDDWDGETGRRKNRERIEIERQDRERSPELESGFSRLVQRKAALDQERFPSLNEAWDKDHSHVEGSGDKAPIPARPSDRGVARIGVPGHPGRERVEQHVLQEQLRLQEMASPGKDTTAEEQGHSDKGIVHHMFDAVVTPVKNFFFRD